MAVKTTERTSSITTPTDDVARRAWRVLLSAFMLFCVLLTIGTYGIFRFRLSAEVTPTTPAVISLQASSGVMIQQRGMVQKLPAQDGSTLYEGDTIYIAPELSYGRVTSLQLFDGTRVELWPGSILQLQRLQTTRFNNERQTIELRLRGGMARLHVPRRQPYEQSVYRIFSERPDGDSDMVQLHTTGVYTVRLLEQGSPSTVRAQWDQAPATEIAVSSGQATIQSGSRSVKLDMGQRVVIGEQILTDPEAASWELVRDGDFSQFSQDEYNCTTQICGTNAISSTTWQVRAEPAEQGVQCRYCQFRITEGPPNGQDRRTGQRNNAANFTRLDSGGKGFRIYVHQGIEADVTPYSALSFKADIRILDQSLTKAGHLGEECPLTISFRYTNNHNKEVQQDYCYYAIEDESKSISLKEWIKTERIEQYVWTTKQIDLRAEIPHMRRLNELWIYANGHDYVVEVAKVSIVAR